MNARALRMAVATLLASGALVAPVARANVEGDVPSCYRASHLDAPAAAPARELFVMIDQTTVLDAGLRQSVLQNLWNVLGPDTAFTVVRFSAFSQGRYTEVIDAGRIEPALDDARRGQTPETAAEKLDACLAKQAPFARRQAALAAKKAMDDATDQLARSDIMAALRDVSQRVKASAAHDRILFLVSDMLENSSVSSFYANATRMRAVDPARELALATKAGMLADFGGARVFVLGAGVMPPGSAGRNSYRDPKTMSALKAFWSAYFERSAAHLELFGDPSLVSPVR